MESTGVELRGVRANETMFSHLQRLAAGLHYWFPLVFFFWWFQETKIRSFPSLYSYTVYKNLLVMFYSHLTNTVGILNVDYWNTNLSVYSSRK